jgi:hypothetical protein
VDIEVKKDIDDFEMTSNDALQLRLNADGTSFQGRLTIDWLQSQDNVVWSVGVIFTRSVGTNTYYDIVKDVIDVDNQTSMGDVSGGNISVINSNDVNNSFELDLSVITDPDTGNALTGVTLEYLRLRPITNENVIVSIDSNGTSYPNQFLELNAQTYIDSADADSSTPTPLLSIKKPLWPSLPGIFDYVYYTNQGVDGPP